MLSGVERHKKICEELNNTYARKNSDYGDAFGHSIDTFGISAAMIRISDKYYRALNLTRSKNIKVEDETLRDTLLDMANYCIMTVMKLEEGEIK